MNVKKTKSSKKIILKITMSMIDGGSESRSGETVDSLEKILRRGRELNEIRIQGRERYREQTKREPEARER